MILTLKVKLIGGMYAKDDWQGVIEIDETDTLEDLHYAIQKTVAFDNDHMYEFRVGRTPRSRDSQVLEDTTNHRFDSGNGNGNAQTIGSLYPLPDKKSLFYFFDYGDSWLFKILKTRKTCFEPLPGITCPRLVQETGDKPQQYPNWDEDEE